MLAMAILECMENDIIWCNAAMAAVSSKCAR